MKGGVKKIFNFIKSKGVSNNFDPKNERNKSSDFKTQQKKNTNFNLLLNTENISSIVREIPKTVLEKEYSNSPKSLSNLNLDFSDQNQSIVNDSFVIGRNCLKDKSKRLISYQREPVQKIENKYSIQKKQTNQCVNKTSENLNGFHFNKKNSCDNYMKSLLPDKKRNSTDEAFKNDTFDKYAFNNTLNNKLSNIKVVVRFRPFNDIEQQLNNNNLETKSIDIRDNFSINIKGTCTGDITFNFDRIFDMKSSQKDLFTNVAKETLSDVLAGYNGTILTYGQSSSGKTYTMYGKDLYDDEKKGIIPNSIDYIFNYINNSEEGVVFQLKFSILQIYKEVIYDLLTGEKDLKIKESPDKGIYVEGLTEIYINSVEEFIELIDYSHQQRAVSNTKLNQFSSRSHSIFMLEITQNYSNDYSKKGTLYLVDLAGSEKVSKTGAVGEILEEAKKINLSLSALGNVIKSIQFNSDHIPYRDSKLTRILKESLGGNNKTSLIVSVSPHSSHFEETLSSLKFAQRVKSIKTKAVINVKLSYDELFKINNILKREIEDANNEINQLKDLLSKGNDSNKINNSNSVLKSLDKTNKTEAFDKSYFKTSYFLENDTKNVDILHLNKSNEHRDKVSEFLNVLKKSDIVKRGNTSEIHSIDEIECALNTSHKIEENKDIIIKRLENQIKSLESEVLNKNKKVKELEISNKEYHNKNIEITEEFNRYKNSKVDLDSINEIYSKILKTKVIEYGKEEFSTLNNYLLNQDKILNSFNTSCEFIMNTLVTQQTKKCKEETSVILDPSNDFKEGDYLTKINRKLFKTILDDLSKDSNLDKIKQNIYKLLNFFKENDETNAKNRYNFLLYFMIYTLSKNICSNKLLENFNENLLIKYRNAHGQILLLMSIVDSLSECTYDLLQKNIDLNKFSNDYNLHNYNTLSINNNITPKFCVSRCSGKIEKFISRKTNKILKMISPTSTIEGNYKVSRLEENIATLQKTENTSFEEDYYKRFFDKLVENFEKFRSLREYVVHSLDLTTENKYYIKEVNKGFTDLINKKIENLNEDLTNITTTKANSNTYLNEKKTAELNKSKSKGKTNDKPIKSVNTISVTLVKKELVNLSKSPNKSQSSNKNTSSIIVQSDPSYLSPNYKPSLNEKPKSKNSRNNVNLQQQSKSIIDKSNKMKMKKKEFDLHATINKSKEYDLNSTINNSIFHKKDQNFSKLNDTSTWNDKKKKSDLLEMTANEQMFEDNEFNIIKLNYSQNLFLEDSNFKIAPKDTLKNIQSMIDDYAKTGVATKKFDGITVKKNDKSTTLYIDGGLNAINKISSPIHEKLSESINGDNTLPIDESFISNK